PQTLAVIGLAFGTFMSFLVGGHWAAGGVDAFLLFIPNAFAYFLVCLHFGSQKKLRTIAVLLLFVCLFVIGRGAIELRHGLPTAEQAQAMTQDEVDASYLLGMN